MAKEEVEATRNDSLTGLPNRKFFEETWAEVIARAKASGSAKCVSLLMIDVDNFQRVNDSLGTAVGDQILKELAKTIASKTRASADPTTSRRGEDFLVRFEGEEFVLVLDNVNTDIALRVGDRIRTAVEARSNWPGDLEELTISVGIATFPKDANVDHDLVKQATIAMRFAKTEWGGNRSCAYSAVPKTFEGSK